jgi:hypothetical protein
MNATVPEKLVSALAAKTAISFTQEMVRTDSTNGKEDALARQLEATLSAEHHGIAAQFIAQQKRRQTRQQD